MMYVCARMVSYDGLQETYYSIYPLDHNSSRKFVGNLNESVFLRNLLQKANERVRKRPL